MTYPASVTNPLAVRLCHDLPGLHIEVARVWITSESGAYNNPLGVTSGGKLVHYSTLAAGIDAAAARLKTSGYYAGIRASLHGSIRDQALAIIASPWNVRNSPYYRRVFGAAGLLTVATVPTAIQLRIAVLKKDVAILAHDIAVNKAAGKTAAAKIDEESLAKVEAELASLQ